MRININKPTDHSRTILARRRYSQLQSLNGLIYKLPKTCHSYVYRMSGHKQPTERQKPGDIVEDNWMVRGSRESHDCINKIRSCEEIYFVEALQQRNKDLELIKLSIGDPTVFGNLPPHPAVKEAVQKVLEEGKYNGYGHSSGLEVARRAVAEEHSIPDAPLTADDVVMTSSCSGAVDLAIMVLANPGQNILVPNPAFSLYHCLTAARGVDMKFYKLQPEQFWEADLTHMESLIDEKTAAILVNNPSNPCGSVYSKQHLLDIINVAERHRLPIIADEIYGGMVFHGQVFYSMASLSKKVPILSCGGIAKKFVVPGWRLGWILVHDRNDTFTAEVIPGLSRLAMKILGPCTLVQAAIPDILKNVPQSYHQRNMEVYEENARMCCEELSSVPGLKAVMPAGAMYMMVVIELQHFPEFKDDIAFTRHLVMEQSVFCLPGFAFHSTQCFRVVLVMPKEKISVACSRIAEFCKKHYKP